MMRLIRDNFLEGVLVWGALFYAGTQWEKGNNGTSLALFIFAVMASGVLSAWRRYSAVSSAEAAE
jgi:hypothetical protein